jgi:hypothetical protein
VATGSDPLAVESTPSDLVETSAVESPRAVQVGNEGMIPVLVVGSVMVVVVAVTVTQPFVLPEFTLTFVYSVT